MFEGERFFIEKHQSLVYIWVFRMGTYDARLELTHSLENRSNGFRTARSRVAKKLLWCVRALSQT